MPPFVVASRALPPSLSFHGVASFAAIYTEMRSPTENLTARVYRPRRPRGKYCIPSKLREEDPSSSSIWSYDM